MLQLTLSDVLALAEIMTAARTGQPIARVMEDGSVTYGTARSIGDNRGNFARDDDTITDLYLRVTTQAGWEVFWPLAEVIADFKAGNVALNYAPK